MAAPALWIRWHRLGTHWSVAHRVALATHRADEILAAGAVRLACGRYAPEAMVAEVEVVAAGLTARPCLACLTRWNGGRA